MGPVYDLMGKLIQEGVASQQKFSVDPRPVDKNVPANFLQKLIFNKIMYATQESYEKQLAHKEDTISFFKELTERQQKELEKAEAVSSDYLHRIDTKNQQLLEAYSEIRQLNTEMMKMVSSNADDMKGMIERFFRLTDAHTAEVKALTQK